MCTAIFDNKYGHFFGRTLDLECSFGESVAKINKGDAYPYINYGNIECKYSLIGMAHTASAQPLFYDAVNDRGLCAAALNFPSFAVYHEKKDGCINLASFEVIPYILSQCSSISEAEDLLERTVITNDDFSPELKSTTLHWMIADRESAIVVESVEDGVKIYDNPFGVMTNSPPFPYHMSNVCNYLSLSSYPSNNTIVPTQKLVPYSRGLGAFGLPGDYSSSSRFVRALFAKEHTLMPSRINEIQQKNGERQRILDIMSTVSLPYGITRTDKGEPIYTVYTSCIDMENCEYSYFTFYDRKIKTYKF